MVWFRISFSYLFALALLLVIVAGPAVLLTSMDAPGSDCFFMPHKEVVCDMSTLEHIEHWQSTFTSTIVKSLIALGLAIVTVLVLWKYIRPRQSYRFAHYHAPPKPTLFQELFSRGLLNSKAY